jgi:flagellar basal-body rod modification protein FlgD
MSSVAGILGQSDFSTGTTTSQNAEDKTMFLKLLVAQLTHQDPLNPVEDKEFIAQLAQFTSVEKLQNIDDGIQNMVSAYDRDQLTSAAALMGRRVISSGYSVTKATDADGTPFATPLLYTAPVELATCAITVLNPSSGQIVYAEEQGAKLADNYSFVWDGRNNAGAAVPDGVYEVSVTATDLNGKKVLIDTEVYGDVLLVERVDGEYTLRLSDGRSVKFTDVNTIGYIPSSSGSDTATDDASADDTASGDGS